MDLFVVPTISFRLLYGLLIMGHGRRQILWLGVTAQPTAEWIANQLTAACGWEQIPRDLIRDRDACYGCLFVRRVRSLGIRDHPTSARSPWQNGYAERLIGSIRRECLDHIVVTGEQHLRNILKCYMEYYNAVRTHLSLGKDAPIGIAAYAWWTAPSVRTDLICGRDRGREVGSHRVNQAHTLGVPACQCRCRVRNPTYGNYSASPRIQDCCRFSLLYRQGMVNWAVIHSRWQPFFFLVARAISPAC